MASAAILWAFSGISGKYLYMTGIQPGELVQARVTIASALFLTGFLIFRKSLLKISPSDIVPFLILGGVVMAMLQLTYFLAVVNIQVAAAILLQYLAPILVAAFSMIFWKERCTLVKLSALVLSLGGCYLVVGGYSLALVSMNRSGLFWGVCSAIFFAAYTLFVEKQMHRFSPWTVLFYSLLFASISLNAVLGPFAVLKHDPTVRQWLLIFFIAVFGTMIPFGLFSVGISHIRATRAVITATLEPVSAAVAAFFLISETLILPQIAGGVLVLAAVVLLQLEREHDDLSPEAIRARMRK